MPIYETQKGKFKIKNVSGESNTKREALKRLMAIKSSQGEKTNDLDEYGYKIAGRRPNKLREVEEDEKVKSRMA